MKDVGQPLRRILGKLYEEEIRESARFARMHRKAMRKKAYDELYGLLHQLEVLLMWIHGTGRMKDVDGYWENFIRMYRRMG